VPKSKSARCTTYKRNKISCLHESVQKLPGQMECNQLRRSDFGLNSEATPGADFFTTQKRKTPQPRTLKAAGGTWRAAGGWSRLIPTVRPPRCDPPRLTVDLLADSHHFRGFLSVPKMHHRHQNVTSARESVHSRTGEAASDQPPAAFHIPPAAFGIVGCERIRFCVVKNISTRWFV
jgi:hypothetical protein